MDEPFQSLDIPLRIALMDLTRSLLAEFPRLAVMVTHDPREAAYLGNRIIVLGESPLGIVYDERVDLAPEDRSYGSAAQGKLERHLLPLLQSTTAMTGPNNPFQKLEARTQNILR
jgi:NitT/TauT family transport system ATP-binding protein